MSNAAACAIVACGGRGRITDLQQPRYGARALDINLPYQREAAPGGADGVCDLSGAGRGD